MIPADARRRRLIRIRAVTYYFIYKHISERYPPSCCGGPLPTIAVILLRYGYVWYLRAAFRSHRLRCTSSLRWDGTAVRTASARLTVLPFLRAQSVDWVFCCPYAQRMRIVPPIRHIFDYWASLYRLLIFMFIRFIYLYIVLTRDQFTRFCKLSLPLNPLSPAPP